MSITLFCTLETNKEKREWIEQKFWKSTFCSSGSCDGDDRLGNFSQKIIMGSCG